MGVTEVTEVAVMAEVAEVAIQVLGPMVVLMGGNRH